MKLLLRRSRTFSTSAVTICIQAKVEKASAAAADATANAAEATANAAKVHEE